MYPLRYIFVTLAACILSGVDSQRAIFERYEIRYEYMSNQAGRFVVEVSANLTGSSLFPESIVAVPGSRLWTVSLYASNTIDGSISAEEFPGITLSQEQAAQTFVPGGMVMFKIPLNLDMDLLLTDYQYLCLKTRKDPLANPDFDFVYGTEDEVTLCLGINFNVPVANLAVDPPEVMLPEVPDVIKDFQRAIFVHYEIQYKYFSSPEGRFVVEVSANLTGSGLSEASIVAVPGSRLWMVSLFASNTDDGSISAEEFPAVTLSQEQAAQIFVPGGMVMFKIPLNLDMDSLTDYQYLCLKTQKDPLANPDFEFVYGTEDEVTLCLEINFNVPVVILPDVPINLPPDVVDEIRRVDVTQLELSVNFRHPFKSSYTVLMQVTYGLAFGIATNVIEDEDVWQIRVFVDGKEDGTGPKKVISTLLQGSAGTRLEPDTVKKFTTAVSLDYNADYGPGTRYPYVCFTFSKHPATDVEVVFLGEESATECVTLPEFVVEPEQIIFPLEPVVENFRTCQLWGDPHHKTFDGYGYSHQGDAEYIAVTTCFNDDNSVPDFEIVVDNFRRKPSVPVTYIREHRLYYNGVVYALTYPDEVTVNGVKITLPYKDADNGIDINYAAPHKVLTTDFGLTIRYDNKFNSDITLPERFMNKVCGLCGNFDDNRANECHYRNGTEMGQNNEECKLIHVKEWIYDTPETGYPYEFRRALRPCDEGSPYLDTAQQECGIITDPAGPLSACHKVIDPEIYFTTCVYDLCQLLPGVFFLCGSVETYIYDCGAASDWQVEVGDWRAVATSCEPTCAGNMTFNPRGSSCQPSCGDDPDNSRTACPFPALEMCFCPEGTLLDGITCVPAEECGCRMDNGRYLSIGEWFMSVDCSERCKCHGNNDLRCHISTCAEHAQCGVKSGVRKCYCDDGYMGNGQIECTTAGKFCHIYGDPHFHTFDEESYSFQGDCNYVATRTCKPLPAHTPQFSVIIENDALIPEERYTYLTMIKLNFKRMTYKLKYTGEISVDGEDVANSLPYKDDNVKVTRVGKELVLETSSGLKITYDGEYDAEIELPEAYFGKVCGLCGNADGNSTNDKQKPDGTLAKKLDFANSWGVGGCAQVEKKVETCEPGTKDYDQAVDICSEIAKANGPFAYCHGFKSPFKFVESCIYDLCGTLPSTDLFCSSASQYLKACREKGGIVAVDWEKDVKYCGSVTCSEGYVNYKQSCYKFVPTLANYESAKTSCEAETAHLVTISSRVENNFVAELSQNERCWLGATRNPSASFSEYQSRPHSAYTFLPNRLTRGIGSFRFSVQTHSEAHLLLSTSKDIDGETPVYEIVLGADQNKRNFIRRCQDCQPVDTQMKSYLNRRRAREFFVNFHEGKIQVGDVKNRELILNFVDPLPMRVRYIGFKTVNRIGHWKFYDTEFMWDVDQPWNYDNYRFGEPSNHDTEEGCLETNFLMPGIWNDHFCSEKKAFVCEIDAY